MKIILNFVPLKSGGGLQVALDFLNNVKLYGSSHEWYIVSRKGSKFKEHRTNKNIHHYHSVDDNLLSRLYFEYLGCKKIVNEVKPDVIYTQFGPHWPGANCVHIAGCAYSNLFYPELDFWGKLPYFLKIKKKLIDYMRLKRILSTDIMIFETEDLARRAKEQFNLRPGRVKFVRSAVSNLVSLNASHKETKERCNLLPPGFKILLLAGYHPNKNIEFTVHVAQKIEELNKHDDVIFVLTLPTEDPNTKKVMELVCKLGVAHRVVNIGRIPPEGCADIYRACDAAILPSTLESFSNTIIESWTLKKPLLISDLSWSRSLCGNGAVYYDFLNETSLIESIELLRSSSEYMRDVVLRGSEMLDSYPSSKQRFLTYLNIIEKSFS